MDQELLGNTKQDLTNPYPYFQGLVPFPWKANRFYRVYLLPGELVFICLRAGGEFADAINTQFGLVVVLVKMIFKRAKNRPPQRYWLDLNRWDEVVAQFKHSFRCQPGELTDVSIDLRSQWLAAMYSHPHVGVLRFTHPSQGKLNLLLETVQDMQIAVRTLPAALGFRVAVNVEWDEEKKKFIKYM